MSVSRHLTASFIVTASMLVGCSSTNPPGHGHHGHTNPPGPESTAEPHQNPPGPDATAEPHQNPPAPGTDAEPHKNPPAPQDAETDRGHGHINPPAPKPTDKPEALAAAPEGWTVKTRTDGSCWAYAKVSCPEGMRCNPPPPRQVKCP